jgi:hypothetical protein
MKHIHRITVAHASADDTEITVNELLDRVFAFILDLVDAKGKGNNAAS